MPWTKIMAEHSNDNNEHTHLFGEGERVLSYQQAITEAIEQSLTIDSNVILMGEGIDAAGYLYDTTIGLAEKFGRDRIIETPIAEAAMTGMALGAAVTGKRPVLMHMRNDFLLVSMDQIINHIAHWQELFNIDVPLVIRAIVARGWGSGAQHSQSFQRLFAGFDGIDVYMPATPYDVKGMYLNAVASNRPVLFLEHRWLYNDKGYVPEQPYFVSANKAALRRSGKDVTVLGMSLSNRDAEQAADALQAKGIEVEWIDLRTVSPIDWETITASVLKTGRLVILENGTAGYGIGSEIAARVQKSCFNRLKCPIEIIGWNKTTIPAGVRLEAQAYPKLDDIIEKIESAVKNYE